MTRDWEKSMKRLLGIVIGGGFIVLIFVAIFFLVRALIKDKQTEPFGDVVGAAGEFRDQYFTCVNQCQKTDPTDRLSQEPWACGMYCDDVVSRSVAAGRQLGQLVSVGDRCNTWCKGSSDSLACRAGCECAVNVDQYCKQQCKYGSALGFPECFSSCVSLKSQNCAGGNSWFWRPT